MCLVYMGKKPFNCSSFQSSIYGGKLNKFCSLFPSLILPITIFPNQVTRFKKFIPYHFPRNFPPVYALKRAHIQTINIRSASVSQFGTFIFFQNLIALIWTRFKVLEFFFLFIGSNTRLHTQICVPKHRSTINYRSKNKAIYSNIGGNILFPTQIPVPTHRSTLK